MKKRTGLIVLLLGCLLFMGNTYAEKDSGETYFVFSEMTHRATCPQSAQELIAANGSSSSELAPACGCTPQSTGEAVTAMKELPEKDSANTDIASTTMEAVFGTKPLELSEDVYVKNLQAYLNMFLDELADKSLGVISVNRLAENGIFDENTHAAVVVFQQHIGLKDDGTIDENSKAALIERYGNLVDDNNADDDFESEVND